MGYKGPEYYDKMYLASFSGGYRGDPRQSGYYESIWLPTLMMIGKEPCELIDIGCGTGQFAELAEEAGHNIIYGVDYSETAIELASKRIPVPFYCMDMFNHEHRQLRADTTADVIVATEVLEHLENDLDFFELVFPGEKVVLSVPNFMCDGHVRCFKDGMEVRRRYSPLMTIEGMTIRGWREKKWFTFWGFRRS